MSLAQEILKLLERDSAGTSVPEDVDALAVLRQAAETKYSDDQPRGSDGKFSTGGGGGSDDDGDGLIGPTQGEAMGAERSANRLERTVDRMGDAEGLMQDTLNEVSAIATDITDASGEGWDEATDRQRAAPVKAAERRLVRLERAHARNEQLMNKVQEQHDDVQARTKSWPKDIEREHIRAGAKERLKEAKDIVKSGAAAIKEASSIIGEIKRITGKK